MAVLVENSVKIRSKEVNRNRTDLDVEGLNTQMIFSFLSFHLKVMILMEIWHLWQMFGSWDYYRTFVTFQK